MRFAIVIERASRNYAAYAPDLPGCVATAATRRAVEKRIGKAIELHLAGMREDGLAIPRPSTSLGWVSIPFVTGAPKRRKAG